MNVMGNAIRDRLALLLNENSQIIPTFMQITLSDADYIRNITITIRMSDAVNRMLARQHAEIETPGFQCGTNQYGIRDLL